MLFLYKFDDRHFSIVTLTGDSPQDTAIPSLALGIPIGGSVKERVDELLVVDPCHGLTPGMQIASLSKLDHVVDVFSDRTGTDQSGLDAAVSDDFRSERPKKGLSLIGGFAELVEALAMGDHI